MKIKPAQYAKSLYESTKGKSQAEIDAAVLNFVKMLVKNGQLKEKKNILKKFEEIYDKENGIVKAEITCREPLSAELRDKVCAYLRNKYLAKEVVIKEETDRQLGGGIIIKVGDEIFDGSIRGQLRNLQKAIAKA